MDELSLNELKKYCIGSVAGVSPVVENNTAFAALRENAKRNFTTGNLEDVSVGSNLHKLSQDQKNQIIQLSKDNVDVHRITSITKTDLQTVIDVLDEHESQ